MGRRWLSANLWVSAAGGLISTVVGRGCRWVSTLVFFFSFLVVVDCGLCDQRQARMVVTGLGGVVGFSVGLAMKNSCGTWGNILIAVASLGLFKILWGKNLKCTVILAGLLF